MLCLRSRDSSCDRWRRCLCRNRLKRNRCRHEFAVPLQCTNHSRPWFPITLNDFLAQDPHLDEFMRLSNYSYLLGFALTILPAGFYSQKWSPSAVAGLTMLALAAVTFATPFAITYDKRLSYLAHFLSGGVSVRWMDFELCPVYRFLSPSRQCCIP